MHVAGFRPDPPAPFPGLVPSPSNLPVIMNRQIPNLTPKGHLHHLLQFAAILGADAPIRPTRNRHAQPIPIPRPRQTHGTLPTMLRALREA